MPNTPVPAADTGLPTRRRALTALAGLGAALGLPGATQAAIPPEHPDAGLIAHAAMVEELARRYNAAVDRGSDLESEAERLWPIASHPPRPEQPNRFDSVLEKGEDGSILYRTIRKPVDTAAELAFAQQTAAMAAWEAERDAIEERIGLEDAHALSGDLHGALEDAASDLTPMSARTLAGVLAKARAALALDPHGDDMLNGFEDELRSSVIHDLVAIGGAAA